MTTTTAAAKSTSTSSALLVDEGVGPALPAWDAGMRSQALQKRGKIDARNGGGDARAQVDADAMRAA
jgi:hypothetical protein